MQIPAWIKIVFVAVVLVIVGTLISEYLNPTERPAPHFPSYVRADHTITVLAIDLDTDNNPNLKDVLKGTDGVLVVRQTKNGREVRDLIQGQAVLAVLDQNKDGRIDAHDPIFNQLDLMFLTKDNKIKANYTPLVRAGIRAITIDPKYISPQTRKNNFVYTPGTVLMADGSTRLIRDLIMYEPLPR